jgi:hypothetical protein
MKNLLQPAPAVAGQTKRLSGLDAAGSMIRRYRARVLLISPSVVFDPTCHVPPVRVVVRPVD